MSVDDIAHRCPVLRPPLNARSPTSIIAHQIPLQPCDRGLSSSCRVQITTVPPHKEYFLYGCLPGFTVALKKPPSEAIFRTEFYYFLRRIYLRKRPTRQEFDSIRRRHSWQANRDGRAIFLHRCGRTRTSRGARHGDRKFPRIVGSFARTRTSRDGAITAPRRRATECPRRDAAGPPQDMDLMRVDKRESRRDAVLR